MPDAIEGFEAPSGKVGLALRRIAFPRAKGCKIPVPRRKKVTVCPFEVLPCIEEGD
jgi:hypothetical protein